MEPVTWDRRSLRGCSPTSTSVRVLDSLAVGDGSSLLPVWATGTYEFVRGDVRDEAVRSAALEDVDAVVHLAAIVGDPACSRDPERTREVNLEATRALIEESRQRDVSRFVFASTCSNYGKMVDTGAMATEEWELRPVSLYAETKVAAELEILAANGRASRRRVCASRRCMASRRACGSTSP